MSLYTFPNTSPVKEVAFHHANDRHPVALLAATENAGIDKLSAIRSAMGANKWACDPVSVEGKEVLQVSGFETEQQLLNFMQSSHFLEGKPEFTPEPSDHSKRTTGEWMQANGLKLGGWLNLIGDGALLASGIMSGRGKDITAGALYTAGAGVLARYGNVKTEYHVREVLEKTGDFLKKQAVTLPEDCSLSAIMKDKQDGLLTNTERLLYRYPSEVMLSAYTLGAFTMLQSGLKQKNPWGVAYGASSIGIKTASLLIPEKHKTEEEKATAVNHGPVGKLVDWIQEKPLRVFGFGNMVSDVLLGLSACREMKTDKKQLSSIFKLITSGTYILADVFFAVSHKDPTNGDGKFDKDEQRRIEAMAAEAISGQPQKLQSALVQNVAGFLSTQPVMNGTAFDIAKSIQEQLSHVNSNPWTHRTETDTLGSPTISSR